MLVFHFFFFFSSRRRHTRLQGDWSSDVCSSDLYGFGAYRWEHHTQALVSRLNGARTALQPGAVDFSELTSLPHAGWQARRVLEFRQERRQEAETCDVPVVRLAFDGGLEQEVKHVGSL